MAEPAFISIVPGALVSTQGRRFKVTHVLGLEYVLVQDLDTNGFERLRIDQLRPLAPVHGPGYSEHQEFQEFSAAEWELAQRRLGWIKPLIDDPYRTKDKALAVAKQARVHVSTVYEWVQLYEKAGHSSVLIPRKRGRKDGETRLNKDTERIVQAVIKQYYLDEQRLKAQVIAEKVKESCLAAKVAVPHPNTVRNRIHRLPRPEALRRRGKKDVARNLFEPIKGSFPGADYPLAVVQIDHTPANIILVEEHTRLPMSGRPTVTLAIDVYSRMVVGWYVSMEKPNAMAAGMCLARAMLPKNQALAELNVPGEWPVWGKIRKIYADNAKEFRGAMLQRACEEYGIDVEFRPRKKPHYGGHIERLMLTSSQEIETLPGTTFSSPEERGGYDSEKHAALTLYEFEQRLVDWIVNIYNKRPHKALKKTPPIRQWEKGVLGGPFQKAVGVPTIPGDPERLHIDFLPFVQRTVQPYGIVIDEIHYYHEVLNRWINAPDPVRPKLKRQFYVRRDPRDISYVYFYDPEAKLHYKIPYRDTSHPPISVYELRLALNRLKKEGEEQVDEVGIFRTIARMRQRVADAVTKTKAARRQFHRIQQTQKQATPKQPTSGNSPSRFPPSSENSLPVDTGSVVVGTSEDDLFAEPVEALEDLGVRS